MGATPEFKTEGTLIPDNLVAGHSNLVEERVTLASGQNLTRGALLGQITAGGNFVHSLSASSDGSEAPQAILIQDTDASGGDVEVMVYVHGEFNENAVVFGTGHTADSVRAALRARGIYLKANLPA